MEFNVTHYNVVLIDDERLDRELMRELISRYCHHFTIIGEADNVISGTRLIERLQPNVVFLDILMPNGTGFDLLKAFSSVKREFLVVFVTGHEEFGIRAVKSGAFDYLMKPVDVDELIELHKKINLHFKSNQTAVKDRIQIYHNKERTFVDSDKIICIEANGSYSKIYLKDGTNRMVSKNINQLLNEINNEELIRVHRSFVINYMQVKSYRTLGNEWLVDMDLDIQAKVSRKYREEFKKCILL